MKLWCPVTQTHRHTNTHWWLTSFPQPQGWIDNFNGPSGVFIAVSWLLFGETPPYFLPPTVLTLLPLLFPGGKGDPAHHEGQQWRRGRPHSSGRGHQPHAGRWVVHRRAPVRVETPESGKSFLVEGSYFQFCGGKKSSIVMENLPQVSFPRCTAITNLKILLEHPWHHLWQL